jgi:hypothetical protein
MALCEPSAVAVVPDLVRVFEDLLENLSKPAVGDRRIEPSLNSAPTQLSDSNAVQIMPDANTKLIACEKAEVFRVVLVGFSVKSLYQFLRLRRLMRR